MMQQEMFEEEKSGNGKVPHKPPLETRVDRLEESVEYIKARIPTSLEKKGAAVSLVILAIAQVLKALGVPVDDALPLLIGG